MTRTTLPKSLRDLKRSLSLGAPRSWAFLAGSGISVPSGLLTAWDFNDRIAGFLSASASEKRSIRSLLTTSSARAQNQLRFEQVVEILREIAGDKDLLVLNTFDDPGSPTDLHFFLARMLRQGAAIMTTNFDCLIERAFLSLKQLAPDKQQRLLQIHLESGRAKHSSSTFRWYAAQRQLKPAVLKLHGTLRTMSFQESNGAATFSKSVQTSVGATLDALGRAAATPGLEPMKDKVLRRAIRHRTLCVLGYSGSDDFDIVPSLTRAASTIQNIVWIRHAPGRIRIRFDASAKAMLPGPLAQAAVRNKVIVIEGNTIRIIRSLFGPRTTKVPVNVSTAAFKPAERFETLPPYKTMTPSRKLMLRGYFEETALALPAAQRTYPRATLLAKRDRDVRSEVFSLARLGHLARVRGRLLDAAGFLDRAQKLLPALSGDHRLAATVFLAAGNVALDQSAWPIANNAYRKAIKHARRVGWLGMEATALNNLGLVYRRQGQLAPARRYILQALKLDRRLRRRSALARDLGNLGIIAHEQGNYREALGYGRQALMLDRDMGNRTTLTTKLIDVAFALIRLGRHAEAKKELQTALRLARTYARPEDEARCWSALGLLQRQQRQVRLSLRYHERALGMFRSIRRREAVAHELFELGTAHNLAGNTPLAQKCLLEALELFRAIENDRMVAKTRRALSSLV